MNWKKINPIWFLTAATGFFLFAVCYYFILFYFPNLKLAKQKVHTITLTKQGFTPKEITINIGDEVVFKTKADRNFWPASDLHPTHGIYSEFDSKEPIASGDSWKFIFTKSGRWRYHDHLFPNTGGVVNVIEKGKIFELPKYLLADCSRLSEPAVCWNEILEQTIKKQGLKEAWAIVDSLYKSQLKFSQDCHGYTHKLGQESYELFVNKQEIPLGTETSYCGYGFYHGFMEEMLANSPNFEEAKGFCKYASGKVSETLADACYHGLGHGAMALSVGITSNYGQVELVLKKAKEVCSLATDSPLTFSRCMSGVFMEMGEYLATEQYGLKPDKINPFSICETQNFEEVKMPCFAQLYVLLASLSGGDFAKAAKFVEKIKEDKYAVESIQTLAGVIKNQDGLKVCHSLQARLRPYCVSGLALGKIMASKPGEEYEQALVVCSEKSLDTKESFACYNLILDHAFRLYGENKKQEICGKILKGFKCENK